jgi:predicted nucleotidyltransferase
MKYKLLKQIKDYFKDIEEVDAVYLFGSIASGRAETTSDIDIAILLKPEVNPYKPVDIQLKVMSDLGMLLKNQVDVVLLGDADPILEHQIRKHGKILIDKSPINRIAYEINARKKYFDFIYRHDNYMETLKNRILQVAK